MSPALSGLFFHDWFVNARIRYKEQHMDHLVGKSRKRKAKEAPIIPSLLDELNQDLVERVLSWLPASSFFRLLSVCK
ncbi:hypothetical protein Cni_G18149 [Canna indica]|uniref:F-box domain-containing protein n=1 Tax=Canna indica TaxID=4628 RepID=A0AAQ3QE42_9LILI|nr:hypothetical protein Cni_G18149 [Canna indica]